MANTRYSYSKARRALTAVLEDLRILAGDTVGPSDVSWQDVAGTAAVNLRHLASLIDDARDPAIVRGKGCEIVFPSPDEDDQPDDEETAREHAIAWPDGDA